jgi:hypothetical protein
MDAPLSLVPATDQHEPVRVLTDFIETTHWPEAIGGAIEELLLKQIIHTVKEVEMLLLNEGYAIGQLAVAAEKFLLR